MHQSQPSNVSPPLTPWYPCLFSALMTLLLFYKEVYLYPLFFLDSTYKQYHVFLCLTSLSVTVSIHVAAAWRYFVLFYG